jgi:GDP-L-fucose synthase
MIAENFENIETISTDTSFPDGQFKKTANNSKLREFVPNFHFTPLKEAIRESAEWFVQNYGSGKVRLGSSSS